MSGQGHIFVINSSILKIHCDALCVSGFHGDPAHPKASSLVSGPLFRSWSNTADGWQNLVVQEQEKKKVDGTRDFSRDDMLIHMRNSGWKEPGIGEAAICATPKIWEHKGDNPAKLPRPIFTDVDRIDEVDGVSLVVSHFVSAALQLPGPGPGPGPPPPLARRSRRLFAIPVIGTGGTGYELETGKVIRALLEALEREISVSGREAFDLVLVCYDAATFAMAQLARSKNGPTKGLPASFTAILSNWVGKCASDLAKIAAAGRLTLFCGAGTSMGAGLPDWCGLLHLVEDELFPGRQRKLHEETGRNLYRFASRLDDECRAITGGPTLKERIAGHLKIDRQTFGLSLALLVALPFRGVVTPNYDTLIEQVISQLWLVGAYFNSLPAQCDLPTGVQMCSRSPTIIQGPEHHSLQPRPGCKTVAAQNAWLRYVAGGHRHHGGRL